MRTFFLLFLLPLILWSCSGEEKTDDGQAVNFSVSGRIEGAANQTVKIVGNSSQGVINVAETTTDGSGSYEVKGNIPGLGIYTMIVGNDENAILLPLDRNDKAVVNGKLGDFALNPQLSGTTWARPMMQYTRLMNAFAAKQMEELPKIKDQGEQLKRFAELKQPVDQFIRSEVEKDPANPVNLVFASWLMPTRELGFKVWSDENLQLLKKIEKAYTAKHSDSPYTRSLSDQIIQLESAYTSYLQYNSGTMSAPEILLKSPQGKDVRLSALKGKVVLVDFWASWCAPCRQENPNVVRMYKEYKAKGFEVFSVSLDQDPNAWKAAIEKDGLVWPNHGSDLMGWQSPLVQAYQFTGIPFTVLLNREGNIVATGLRGAELEQKLKEQLAK
jgi:thiol-disulfide isomerase/thioredoxin